MIAATFRDDLFAGRVGSRIRRHERHRCGHRRRARGAAAPIVTVTGATDAGSGGGRGRSRRSVAAMRASSTCATRAAIAKLVARSAAARYPRQLRRHHSPRRRARSGGVRRSAGHQPDRHDAPLRSGPPAARENNAGASSTRHRCSRIFGGGLVPGYSASKGGVAQLTKSLAIAYAADRIRVNAIAPGWVATQLTQALQDDPGRSAAILARTPLGRWGTPDDIAGTAVFLCSPAASFITGAIMPVDGGYLVA